jgi:hypothetical protein
MIWNLRALSEADVAALKQKLNDIREREELAPAERLHPKLDWANVRSHYDDVSYCLEPYPKSERKSFGMTDNQQDSC